MDIPAALRCRHAEEAVAISCFDDHLSHDRDDEDAGLDERQRANEGEGDRKDLHRGYGRCFV
jgi:hypothetical protein